MCTYSKIKLRSEVITVGNIQVQMMFQPRTLNQTAANDYRFISAQPYGQFKQLQGTAVTKTGQRTFYSKMPAVKMLGRKLDPSLDRVSITSDPTEEFIYEFIIISSAAISVNTEVHMQYWVEFSDRTAVSYI